VTRVPFALLGVVLLVGSATFVGTLQSPPTTQPEVDRAMDRASAETQSALREAAIVAAQDAARHPVTTPADSPYGRVLNSSSPFRDSLRIRVYLRARQALDGISQRRGEVTVSASLPPIERPADLRAAKRRVTVERAGPDGTDMRVRIRGVTVEATRDGRVVGTRTISPTLVVPTPTLAVHDRVDRFERQLNAGPLDPGLGRRLTARLYPVVWARGYAQYEGAPVENVLANRHLALFTNGAVLSLQRDTFGHADPAGRDVYRRVTVHAALTDFLAGTEFPARDLLKDAHSEVGLTPAPADALDSTAAIEPTVRPAQTVTVGINGTADREFVEVAATLEETLDATYSERVHVHQRVTDLGTRQVREPSIPRGWGVVDATTRTSIQVESRDPGRAHAAPGTGHHVIDVYGRTVVRTHTTTYRIEGPRGKTTTATGRTVERTAVTFTLTGNHSLGPAPVRPIERVHERGGPADGPNLADIEGTAHRRAIEVRGGLDDLAERASGGENVETTVTVTGDRPGAVDDWVYRDLVTVRERVRNISTTTTHGEIATFESNPPATLAGKLRDRRTDLIDVSDRYPNVAQRARVAARTVYVDRLIETLESRARERRQNRDRLADELTDRGPSGDPIERLQQGYDRRSERDPPGRLDGLRLHVDGEPAYLTRTELDGGTVQPIEEGAPEHPLVTRNWNVVTVPYGDVVDRLVDAVLGPDTTRLRTGAQTLEAIEKGKEAADDVERDRLEREVRSGTDLALATARETLAEFDLGDRESRRAVVREATARWNTPGARGLAVANGSAAAAIHEAAVDRWSGQLSDRSRDMLALRLRYDIEATVTSERARPTEPTVDDTADEFREHVRAEIADRVADAAGKVTKAKLEDRFGRELSRLPAGMPVAPSPGFWYATVNLWRVEVAGEYARFSVRVPRGRPDTPGGQLHYVREAGTVELDVDGDGKLETLGHTTRVSFRTGTEVAIAVPPGPQGVGDVDGEAIEESPGWPNPGR